jgi:hypothetical protein
MDNVAFCSDILDEISVKIRFLTVFFGKPNVPFVIWFTYTWLDDAQERGFVTSDAPALILERRGGYKCND